MSGTSIRIASVVYDAARRCYHSVVEFFAPGLSRPLAIHVRLDAPLDVPHRHLVRALVAEAQRRGIG